MILLSNISQNFLNLKNDFISISINFFGIYNFFINLLIAVSLIIIFYLIGRKIKLIFFKEDNMFLDIFVNIALGYMLVGSGVLLLGMLGILYHLSLYAYIIVVIAIAAYPFTTLIKRLNFISVIFREYGKQFKKYKWINIAILGFVLIGFLRLIPPETGVDALWYHTDYPRYYLEKHSMMSIDPMGKYYPAVVPALSDMLYVITESIFARDSSRFVHFSFYLIVVLIYLLVFTKKYPFSSFAALLFVTSPVIIRHTSTAYAEFQWITCWLLAIFIVTFKKNNLENITLSAILFGGALATKLWILPFLIVFITYLIIANISKGKKHLFNLIIVFSICSFIIPSLWYLRAYLITGNPLFPTFWSYPSGETNNPFVFSSSLESILVRIKGLVSVSSLSIFGLFFLIFPFFKSRNYKFKNYSYFIFGIILSITQFIINYTWHRFIVPFYSVITIFLAFGVDNLLKTNTYYKYIFGFLYCILFLYYFINTLLILPYGLGWAEKNKYLTGILSRDNSSYYDYNNQFSKLISDKNIVATYGLWGFYYAEFKHIYAEEIFRKGERSLKALEKIGVNKLLVLGNDIEYICKIEKLTDCYLKRYKLLTYYKFPTTNSEQYLYQLKKYVE